MKKYIITGIGTNIGKTIVSAIIVEKLQADYWKPVQAGDLDNSDSINIQKLISNKKSIIHPETFKLKSPLSPHAAAKIDNISISLDDFSLPQTENTLIIEGAGGIMVPLNNQSLMIGLFEKLQGEIIIVSKNYLGSINHTLLTIEAIRKRGLKIAGIVFNGVSTPETEDFIINYSGLSCIGNIPEAKSISKQFITENTNLIRL